MSVARARLVVPDPSRRHSMCSAQCTFVVRSLIRQQQKNSLHHRRRILKLNSKEMSTSAMFGPLRSLTVAQYWPTTMCRYTHLIIMIILKMFYIDLSFSLFCSLLLSSFKCMLIYIYFCSIRTRVLHSSQWCDERSTFSRWYGWHWKWWKS